jgi:hypothetical protein
MNTEQLVTKIMDTELLNYRRNCPQDITDRVFCIIENKYLLEYKELCKHIESGQLNIRIGKFIKKTLESQ